MLRPPSILRIEPTRRRRSSLRAFVVLLLLAAAALAPAQNEPTAPQQRPNLVVVLCDDLGYGDLGCYGNKTLKTPHLDRLAREGVRFTDFYCAGAQCTPSRAGMLTGRYPARFGLTFSLMTDAGAGVPADELLLPEALQQLGYATMLAGKWHLGDQPRFHPRRHGFGRFAGLLRGHDTDPREFWHDEQVVDREAPIDALTRRYTTAAAAFVAEQAKAKRPFFLMLAHTSPHTPLAPGARFRGKSAGGEYGDCVEEIDDSVGQLLEALKTAGALENTLIVFSSDNGPAVHDGKDGGGGGSTGPLRAGKFSTYEGGVRVPAIAWMPARFKPKTEAAPAILLDVFPTLLALAGGKPPAGRPIDGQDLTPLLTATGARGGAAGNGGNGNGGETELFFYFRDQIQACRSGSWKLKLPDPPAAAAAAAADPPQLFDLSKDPAESTDLAAAHPEVVAKLRARIDAAAQRHRARQDEGNRG